MQTNLRLSNLIESTLQEINKLGLCSELKCQYRRTYDRLRGFARNRNADSYSVDLVDCFVADIEKKYRNSSAV